MWAAPHHLDTQSVARFNLAAHMGAILPQLDRLFFAQVGARRDAIFAVDMAEGHAEHAAIVDEGAADPRAGAGARAVGDAAAAVRGRGDRKSTRLNSSH